MAPERRRLIILGSLLGLVTVVALYQFWPTDGVSVPGQPGARGRTAAATATGVTAPDVRLHALEGTKPRPEATTQRDLFRFRTRPAPPAPRPTPPVTAAPGTAPSGAAATPTLPPITMRFIGLVESPEQSRKIAILSDGRGIYQGSEGDIIEGRYRILRIGVESLEIAYLDGRGRQTIRLSGS